MTNTSSSKKVVSGPLHEEFIDAAESGTIDKVLGLLGSGAQIDDNHAGWTALGRAAQNGHLDVARTSLNTEQVLTYEWMSDGASFPVMALL